MNVITTFTSRSDKRRQILEDLGSLPSSVTFGTYTRPLWFEEINPINSEWNSMVKYDKRVLLMNDQTHEPLSIVGKNYRNTSSHADQFGYMEDMIINSSLNLEGLTREISVSHEGGRAYARYRFPEHTVQTGEGDETVMELVGRNSFDGSWPSIFELGAWRMICTNLQVIGTVTAVTKRRHTKHSNIEGAVVGIVTDIYLYQTNKLLKFLLHYLKINMLFKVLIQLIMVLDLFLKHLIKLLRLRTDMSVRLVR